MCRLKLISGRPTAVPGRCWCSHSHSKYYLFVLFFVISNSCRNSCQDYSSHQHNLNNLIEVPKFAPPVVTSDHHEDLLRFEILPPTSHRTTTTTDQDLWLPATPGAGQPYEAANNRSIYSSLTKIIYQLKNQLELQQRLSRRLDGAPAWPNSTFVVGGGGGGGGGGAATAFKQPTSEVKLLNKTTIDNDAQNMTTITVVSSAGETQQDESPSALDGVKIPAAADSDQRRPTPAPVREKRIIAGGEELAQHSTRQQQPLASKSRLKTSGTRQPRWSTATPKQHQQQRASTTTARSSSSSSSSHDTSDDDEQDDNFGDGLALDDHDEFGGHTSLFTFPSSRGPSSPGEDGVKYRTLESSWSSPLLSTSGYVASGPGLRRYAAPKGLQLAEANPMKVGESFGSSKDLGSEPQYQQTAPTAAAGADDEETVLRGDQGARWPRLNPQAIQLQRVYPPSSINSILASQRQSAPPPPIISGDQHDRPNSRTGQLLSPTVGRSPLGASLYTRDLNNQPTSSYATQHQQQQQQQQQHLQQPQHSSTTTAATGLAQQPQPQRDLMMNQPQTIQITAVPNNGGLVNGVLGGGGGGVGVGALNQLLRINTAAGPLLGGQFNNLWNSGLWNTADAFGRPVMMVNAERRQVDWSFWIWPIILVAVLPIVLGALFVPVFLKTVVILIQILQSLGLLLPLASALSQQVAQQVASVTSASSNNNQLEHACRGMHSSQC